MDMLTGESGRRQDRMLAAQTEQFEAGQRRSLAQMSQEQAGLDHAIAAGGQRGRGRSLLTFFSSTGQPTFG